MLLLLAPPPDGAAVVVEGAASGYVVVPVELALLEFGALVLLLSLPQAAQNAATVSKIKIARILRIDFSPASKIDEYSASESIQLFPEFY